MPISLRSIRNVDVSGKRVLVRVDFNVPLDGDRITDDTRIREVLPTLQHLIDAGARIILASHLGRPDGERSDALSLAPVATRLGELLTQPVTLAPDCIGPEVEALVAEMAATDIVLLENTRFHAGEEANDPDFAAGLAHLGDIFVQEAFGTVHRAHASTVGVAQLLSTYAGFLVEREVAALAAILDAPARPLTLVIGGAKIATKLGVLERFIEVADHILIGGAMANTFLATQGFEVGASVYESEKVELARELLLRAAGKIVLPVDVVAADGDAPCANDTPAVDLRIEALPFNMKIYDIGIETRMRFADIIRSSGTVVWNGPVGVSDKQPFAGGTRAIAEVCALTHATTILGGGDTLDAIARFGFRHDEFTHVSTGGGAMLEFLEGKELPGLAVIPKK